MTYNFEVQDNGGVRLNVDGIYKRTFYGASSIEVIDADTFEITDKIGRVHQFEVNARTLSNGSISTTANVFQLEGVLITGSIEDICKTLDPVFLNANTGSGGSGGSGMTADELTWFRNLKASYEEPIS